jgi:small-conductance mechanosensitive channel
MKTEEFLEFLEKPKVQQKIQEITNQDKKQESQEKTKEEELMGIIDNLKKLLGVKESDNKELEQKIESLRGEKQTLIYDNQELSNTLQIKNQELKKQLDFYRKNFESELRIYEKFISLSESTKSSLSGIFKGESLSNFIACGVQEKNIQNLWEYTKAEILEDSNDDISKLVEIFEFFFQRYIIAYPIYESLDTQTQQSFDTELHIKHHSSSSSSGSVSKVYLQGYKNIKTDKIIKKSIVRVG